MSQNEENPFIEPGTKPAFAIAWDPELLPPEMYAELVEILGDLVRANGGAGIRRIKEFIVEVEPKPES